MFSPSSRWPETTSLWDILGSCGIGHSHSSGHSCCPGSYSASEKKEGNTVWVRKVLLVLLRDIFAFSSSVVSDWLFCKNICGLSTIMHTVYHTLFCLLAMPLAVWLAEGIQQSISELPGLSTGRAQSSLKQRVSNVTWMILCEKLHSCIYCALCFPWTWCFWIKNMGNNIQWCLGSLWMIAKVKGQSCCYHTSYVASFTCHLNSRWLKLYALH